MSSQTPYKPALRQRSAQHRQARVPAGAGPCLHRLDRFRRQRHRRPPRHPDPGRGHHRHGAAVAADDGADRHADFVDRFGVAVERRRAPRRDRPAVPPGAVAGAGPGPADVRVPQLHSAGTGAVRHRRGNHSRRARLPARDPLGRAGADAVLLHALPERRHALDPADDADRFRRTGVAGAAGLCVHFRPLWIAGDGRGGTGRGLGDHDVGAGHRLRGLSVECETLRRLEVVRAFRRRRTRSRSDSCCAPACRSG